MNWEAILDPGEIRDYGVDWTEQLGEIAGSPTISNSLWEVESGNVTILTQTRTATTTAVRLTGGTLNTACRLVNTVELSDGERFIQTCVLRVQQR